MVLLFLILSAAVFPQWEVGGTLNFKNEIPERGFGFTVSRNLPFQCPTIGFELRFGVDLFRDTEEQIKNNIETKKKFLSEDYHLSLIGTFFFRNINPYFGLNTGVGHQDINLFDEYIFFIGVLTGVKFPVTNWIHPYLEISSLKYFSRFDEVKAQKDISSFQLKGAAGLLFRFDTSKN
jgi:hypothetical protein